MMPRLVAPEALDHLAADDPVARRSRRDLIRVHRAMGTRSIVARAWRDLVATERTKAPLRILELGAGDGTLLLGVARSLVPAWRHVELTLLDRQDIVTPATLARYAELGWSARVEVADVLEWASRATGGAPRWDLITATLFLHHFEGGQLDAVLARIASSANRFFACEPRRGWMALAGSHLVGAIGANAVTREDAVLSVRAGFRGGEITARWPGAADWHCAEFAAGPFSHCFSARRRGAH